ncbi:MAG: bifunctional metallophosphatase/5'-nucleotidase [Deltaproteobacteria bacterium]|nr:bifunctional metallophosphatase/5'-nucleotidase [Deltaproteobacteria bacterium]
MKRPSSGLHFSASLWFLLFLSCTTTSTSQTVVIRDQDIQLTILHTSDWHSRLIPYKANEVILTDRGLGLDQSKQPFGGVARLAAMIKEERGKADRIAHLDSGDCFQGAPIFNIFNGETEIRAMSEIGVDAVVIGNHEFDKGTANLATQLSRWAKFPSLAANYIYHDIRVPGVTQLANLAQPYTILNVNGLKLGVIGAANFSSMLSVGEGGNKLGLTPIDNVQVLQDYIDFLQPQVDLVILLSHMGLSGGGTSAYSESGCIQPTYDEDEQVIQKTRGIDLVMGGHLHVVTMPPKVVYDLDNRPVVLTHSGAFLKYLGVLHVVVRNKEIVSHSYELRPIDNWDPDKSCADFESDATMKATAACQADGTRYDRLGDCVNVTGASIDAGMATGGTVTKAYCRGCCDPCRVGVKKATDGEMERLMEPYIEEMNRRLNLTRVWGYAPTRVERFSTTGGDSPLGNFVAEAIQRRVRVETDFSLTNSLGIRDVFSKGMVTDEVLFNVLPFENSITKMFLSGNEVQELFDYVTCRSAERGCDSQVQISGATFVMNCVALKGERITIGGSGYPCSADTDCAARGEICTNQRDKNNSKTCRAPIKPEFSYELATNDFIAAGGSGFEVLKRNTTQVNTGITLRSAVSDHIKLQERCKGVELACGDDPQLNVAGSYPPCIAPASDNRITTVTAQ